MKKLFLISFLSLGTILGFVSCGGDDDVTPPPTPPDLSVKDAAIIAGDYTGTVESYLTDFRVKDTLRQTNTVKLTTINIQKLAFQDDALGLGLMLEGDCWHNFKYTDESKTEIVNTIGSARKVWAANSTVPTYIKQWLLENYGTLNSATFVLDKTSANYIISTKKLVFNLSGTLQVNHTLGSLTADKPFKIIYKYTLTKK